MQDLNSSGEQTGTDSVQQGMKECSERWVVMKFGGTSVSSLNRWEVIKSQVQDHLQNQRRVMVVVSAVSGVTNLLTRLVSEPASMEVPGIIESIEALHLELLDELDLSMDEELTTHWNQLLDLAGRTKELHSPAHQARLLAHGELLSSTIGARVLSGLGCRWHDARSLLQSESAGQDATAKAYLAASCNDEADPALSERLAQAGALHITQGFIASNGLGETCLLGRGGSDSSAAYLAARLQAELLEIWTDVPGMFSADPRIVPDARLLQRLSYSEAQELASMGARILHPPSIKPAKTHGIPIVIRDTTRPHQPGTRIEARTQSTEALVKGVVSRKNICVIEMENPAMWHQAGFLADVFAVFKRHAVSVDLIATSEATVTVSLDPGTGLSVDSLTLLLEDLSALSTVQLHHSLVSISLVGNAIRTILGQLSSALDVFQDRQVHMVTQSANDLNLTLVIDEEHADQLVKKLHHLLITSAANHRIDLGPSWAELTLPADKTSIADQWWAEHAISLCELMEGRHAAYVYHIQTAVQAAIRLKALRSVDRVLYSIKANHHPELLHALAAEGLGFECVSMAEVLHVLSCVPGLTAKDVLFTPNFAPRTEYEEAFNLGVTLTLDSLHPLRHWPELFVGKEVFLRVDLDAGYGHHKKVITSGAGSKFGIPINHLEEARGLLATQGARIVGLHTHTGSGVADETVWREQLQRFIPLLQQFRDVRVVDLGGGLFVPERPGQASFNLNAMDGLLSDLLEEIGHGADLQIWLEPGRYISAECGVLLARVTQLKTKGDFHYIGLATGMNSLIRPALYGAYHHIVNLTQLGATADQRYRIVGPICETGDVFSESRMLPTCAEGDVILIANTGAYGRVMSSGYNMRSPAEEVIFCASTGGLSQEI